MNIDDATFVVTDVETTGTSANDHRILEVGAVKVQGGEAVDRFQHLVNPEQSVPSRITKLTGITTGMVFEAPTVEGPSMRRALACYEFGLHRRAEALLKSIQQQGGEAFAVQYWLGRNLQDEGEPGDALKAYGKALQARPDHVDTIKRIVGLNLVDNRKQEAAKYLEKLVEIRPDDVDTMLFLSDIYGSLREYEKALEWARKALKLAPDNAAAREKVALYTGAVESDSQAE